MSVHLVKKVAFRWKVPIFLSPRYASSPPPKNIHTCSLSHVFCSGRNPRRLHCVLLLNMQRCSECLFVAYCLSVVAHRQYSITSPWGHFAQCCNTGWLFFPPQEYVLLLPFYEPFRCLSSPLEWSCNGT